MTALRETKRGWWRDGVGSVAGFAISLPEVEAAFGVLHLPHRRHGCEETVMAVMTVLHCAVDRAETGYCNVVEEDTRQMWMSQ